MSMVKMSKFNLLAFDYDRSKLLKKLQDFEYVHFNNLNKNEEEEKKDILKKVLPDAHLLEVQEEIQKVSWGIDLLSKFEVKKSKLQDMKEGVKSYTYEEIVKLGNSYDFDPLYNKLQTSQKIIDESNQNIQTAKQGIEDLEHWKDLSIPVKELYDIKRTFVQTGSVPNKFLEDLREDFNKFDNVSIQELSEDKGTTFLVFAGLNKNRKRDLEILRKYGFTPITIGTEKIVKDEISDLSKAIEENKLNIEKEEEVLKGSIESLEDLKVYYEYLQNQKVREESAENFKTSKKINVIQGYVPTRLLDSFEKTLKEILGNRYSLDVEDADKNDPNVPIILENGKFTGAFQGLTEMYSLPKYNEVDPTPLFAPFYAFFAGMMVGDFGYGLLLFVLCMVALKTFNLREDFRRNVKFFCFLSIPTMIWGLIYGSAFGIALPYEPLLSQSEDSMLIILISLILGGIHIFFALGIKAYMLIRDKDIKGAIFDVGFLYLTLIGIILAAASGPANLSENVKNIGIVMLVVGMVGIFLTAGRASKSVGGRIALGLNEVYGLTGYIGDFVSYLRLMALGLAGGFIALAINIIVGMLFGGGIVGIIGGVIIFVVFQLFNLFLSYLSAYVHSARLIYVEMFNKFYEGGGKAFKGLINKPKYFDLEKNENK
ncbi:MAG: V-type ATP synthase subunit I [Lagierella massiliensis]|nr:V-type ATP synthase subunit I [Lagierella massiliensis]